MDGLETTAAPAAVAEPVAAEPVVTTPEPEAAVEPQAQVDPNTPSIENPFADLVVEEDKPEVDPLEALKDNPRVQELMQAEAQFKELQTAISDLPYAVSSAQDLKLQLNDAHMLYDIVTGKVPASGLLQTMLNNPDWTPQQKQAVISDLAQTLQQFSKTPIAAGAAGQPTQSPEAMRLATVEKELADRKTAEQNAAFEKRITDGRTKISSNLKEWIADKAPVEFADKYASRIGAELAGKTEQVLAAVEKGDFAMIQKAAQKVHNEMVKDLKAFGDFVIKQKQSKAAAIPGGKATPVSKPPAGETQEERIARMAQAFAAIKQ